jgi:hypothetical protein
MRRGVSNLSNQIPAVHTVPSSADTLSPAAAPKQQVGAFPEPVGSSSPREDLIQVTTSGCRKVLGLVGERIQVWTQRRLKRKQVSQGKAEQTVPSRQKGGRLPHGGRLKSWGPRPPAFTGVCGYGWSVLGNWVHVFLPPRECGTCR